MYILIEVEEESMQNVLHQSPKEETQEPKCCFSGDVIESFAREVCAVGDRWNPNHRHNPPSCLG